MSDVQNSVSDKLNHPRIRYRKTLLSLYRTKRNASLHYEYSKSSRWPDLVLKVKGKEIARVMTYGHYENNDLRYVA